VLWFVVFRNQTILHSSHATPPPPFSGCYEWHFSCNRRMPSGVLVEIQGSTGSVCDPAGSSLRQTDDGTYNLVTSTGALFSFSGKAIGGDSIACNGSFFLDCKETDRLEGQPDALTVLCDFNGDSADSCSNTTICKEGQFFSGQDERVALTKSYSGPPSPSPSPTPSPSPSPR
jgi:hypothetical protein